MKLNTEIAHCIPEKGNSMTNTKKRKKSFELLEEKCTWLTKETRVSLITSQQQHFIAGEKWINTELTLEQGGFELCGSTYMRFSMLNTTVLHHPWFFESAGVKPWIWRNCGYGVPNISYTWIFYSVEGQVPTLCCSTFVFKIREKRMSQGFYTQQS